MSRVMWMVLLAAAIGSPADAAAQISADGSIRGQVRDEQQVALPAVTVTVTGADVAGLRSAITDGSGVYRLVNLPPGTYTLTAELSGFSPSVRPNVQVRARVNLGVDITLTVGRLEESVQVTAETPILEVARATQGINIDGDVQRSLPLGTRRDWSDFLEIAPGVTSRTINNPQGGQMYAGCAAVYLLTT